MNRVRQWVAVRDEDGNAAVPDTGRSVLVFLCGDRDLLAPRPDDAGHGERFGWYDHARSSWRVGGSQNGYVTHWMDLPDPPAR